MARAFRSGALIGSAPGFLAAVIVSLFNPWFLDRPLLYVLIAVLPLALVGGGLGLLRARYRGWRGFAGARFSFMVMAVVFAGLALRPRPKAEGVDVLVVGVDGATFEVIEPMVAAGELPAFKALGKRGSRTVLRSMEPMFSPLLWTTMASGKPPTDHGIHGFHVHAVDCQVPRFWDIADSEGYGVGIYKWLVTWPPREVSGFIVPGWLAPSAETWPVDLSFVKELELANRLKRKAVAQSRSNVELVVVGLFRGLRFGTVLDATLFTLQDKLEPIGEDDRQVALQLLRGRIDRDVFTWSLAEYQPELATFTYYATDGLAHLFWREFQPDAFEEVDPVRVEKYGDAIPEAYRQADAILGEITELVGERTRVLVVSDHGFQPLKAEGGKAFFAPLTERLQARMRESVGQVDISKLGIKLNVGLVDEAVTYDEAAAWLGALLDEDGEPFFRVEPVPDNPRAVGLTLVDEDVTAERIAAGTVGGEPLKLYVKLTDAFTGEHRSDGIFYAAGPGIPQSRRIAEASLLDIAPTVLAMLGLPPALDLPGEVLILDNIERTVASRDRLVEALDYGGLGRRAVEGSAEDEATQNEMLEAMGYVEGSDEEENAPPN